MDRVGGWYKRRSQWVIAILATVAVVGMNVDAILIFKHLDTHPGVRDALVARAKAYGDSASAAVAAADPSRPASGGAARKATADPGTPLDQQFTDVEQTLMQLNLPLGWVRAKPTPLDLENRLLVPWHESASWSDTVAFHLVGWLLTVLAASLGAPFWFDILNRIISIRSAGKAPEEKPKPPKDVPVPLEPGQSPREAELIKAVQRAG